MHLLSGALRKCIKISRFYSYSVIGVGPVAVAGVVAGATIVALAVVSAVEGTVTAGVATVISSVGSSGVLSCNKIIPPVKVYIFF